MDDTKNFQTIVNAIDAAFRKGAYSLEEAILISDSIRQLNQAMATIPSPVPDAEETTKGQD